MRILRPLSLRLMEMIGRGCILIIFLHPRNDSCIRSLQSDTQRVSQADNESLLFSAGFAAIPIQTVDRSVVSTLLMMEDDRPRVIDQARSRCQASSTCWNLRMKGKFSAVDSCIDDAYRNLDGPLRHNLQAVGSRKRLWVKLAPAGKDRGGRV